MHISEQFRNNGWGKSSLGVTARTTPPHHHATTPPSAGLCVREILCRGMFYFAIVARAKELPYSDVAPLPTEYINARATQPASSIESFSRP